MPSEVSHCCGCLSELQLSDLAVFFIADPELTVSDVAYDLVDFAAGRNTVSSSAKLCRFEYQSRPTRSTLLPLPPPTTFRRARGSIRQRHMQTNIDSLTTSISTFANSEPELSIGEFESAFDYLFILLVSSNSESGM